MTDQSKIVIRYYDRKPKIKEKLSGVIRVDPEAEIAVRRIAKETNLSVREIATQLITQAVAICELRCVPYDD